MKKFKNLVALLMSLTIGASFIGCGDDDKGKKEPPKTPTASEIANEQLQDAVGDLVGNLLAPSAESTGRKYVDGAIEAVQNAATIELDIDANVAYSFTDKQDGVQPTEEGANKSMSLTADVDGAFKAVKTEKGYDMGVELAFKYDFSQGVVESTSTIPSDISIRAYLIDGYGYLFSPEYQAWVKTSLPFELTSTYDDLTLILDAYLGDVAEGFANVSEADFAVMKNLIGKVFDGVCKVEDNALKFETDLKTPLNEMLDEQKNLDLTMTFKDYFNKILKDNGVDLTLDQILDEIATKGSLTIGEGYKAINDWFKEATGKGVNELKNALLTQEDIAYVLNKFSDYIDLTAIKELNIDDLIKPYEDITLDEMIVMMTMAESEESVAPTMSALPIPDLSQMQTSPLAELIKSIKPMLNTTLADLGLGEYVALAQGITIDELKQSVKVGFNNFKLQSFNYALNADFVADLPFAKIDVDADATVALKVSETASAITLPDDATKVYYVFTPFGADNDYFLQFDVYHKEVDGKEVYDFTEPGAGSIYKQVGEYVVYYTFKYQIPEATRENSVPSLELTITDAKIGKGTVTEKACGFTQNDKLSKLVAKQIGEKYTIAFDLTEGSVNLTEIPVPTEAELYEAE